MFAASAFYFLKMQEPDDLGDGDAPDAVAVRELPPRPDSPASRDTSEPAPRAPEAPPPPPSRKSTPRASATPASTAPGDRATATLRIVSDVPGAQVFLNRQFIGATPAIAKDLSPGSYQLNVSAAGYDNHIETVDISAGEREIAIRFREVKLNASIRVVHKHRLGSCEGTLVATAEGLRYDTAHRDDAFDAALTSLETFQVDYLNKNLRVQPPKSRRYDFTDPDGNADRLYVFHRDVERARERLKSGARPAGR